MSQNENEEDTKFCFNCRRNIPVVNYVMHSAYCHRNLTLCPECDEPILTAELNEHKKTMHIETSCGGCFERFQVIDMESHKLNNCSRRLKTCDYCNIQIAAFELAEHVDMCGSRTERCNDCGQFIMIKYLETHKENHKLKKIPNVTNQILDDSAESLAAYPQLTKKVPNTSNSATTRTTSMPSLRFNDPGFMTINRVSPVKRNNDQPQINTLNNNHDVNKESVKDTTLINLPNDDDFYIPGAQSDHNNQPNNLNDYVKNTEDYNNFPDVNVLQGVQLPCEFCSKMINSENLVLHETGCRPDLATFHNILHPKKNVNNLNEKFPVPPLDLESSSESEMNLNNLSLSSDEDEKTNVEKLPCEFCEELIPLNKLIGHQIMCEKVHLDLPKINNFDKNVNAHKSGPVNVSAASTLVLRRPEMTNNSHLPASSNFEHSVIPKLPRVKLQKMNSNTVGSSDNRLVNNSSARNNYEQFLSNSRLNQPETYTRENPTLYLNPSGGAIPKQKTIKGANNRRVLNNFSRQRDSGSSSD
ncbi:TRAF-type zinc finger domain-containing protein 1-like isoform X2 [Adelges cooleyi]|uniref:TRAF-type zinc finger domain-containing protein 1-like isoform X2 n=1 Tax=Adelges cooleyi TaxID=133065 RepID=UPI0021802382|nr:TRAF-type zinc finger domain-containing protein 1-like isoform X2 [Adelges cooleyi]